MAKPQARPRAASDPGREMRPLSQDQIAEVLSLTRDSDSVELKVSVPEADRQSAVRALDLDPLDAQLRQVVFFDTADLALNRLGVVVRARRVQLKSGDSAVKLRPVVPRDLPPALRANAGFGVQVDALPGGFVCSGALKAPADNALVRDVILGRRPIRKLFTREQRRLLTAHAPPGLDLDDLQVLGPVNVLKLKFVPPELRWRVVAELWLYPDGSRVLELSTKCPPDQAFQAAAEFKAYLVAHGVDLSAEQAMKTKMALQYFAGQISEATAS